MIAVDANALLIFARCVGFVSRAPGFAHPSVPRALRASLAAFLAIAIAPNAARSPHPDGLAFVVGAIDELLLGSAIGLAAALVYDAAYAAGRAIDDYVGVKAIAPSVSLVAPSGFGRLWSLAFTGGFFLLGAYRLVLLALAESFARIPPGTVLEPRALLAFGGAFASTMALVAIGLAAPTIAATFLTQLATGAIGRAVPRFGSMTLVFPLAFAASLLATAIEVPALGERIYLPATVQPLFHR